MKLSKRQIEIAEAIRDKNIPPYLQDAFKTIVEALDKGDITLADVKKAHEEIKAKYPEKY